MTSQTFQEWAARQDQRTSPNIHYVGDKVHPHNPNLTFHYRITSVHPHYWRARMEHEAVTDGPEWIITPPSPTDDYRTLYTRLP